MAKLEIVRDDLPSLFQKRSGSRVWWVRCKDYKGRLREMKVGSRERAERKLKALQLITAISRFIKKQEE